MTRSGDERRDSFPSRPVAAPGRSAFMSLVEDGGSVSGSFPMKEVNRQHTQSRPEDVLKVDADEDGVGGDDAADALRYLVASKPRSVAQRKLHGL